MKIAPQLATRRDLAKGITLVESTLSDHKVQAQVLLEQIMPYTGRAFRLGISGVPGVGKSTFIEAFGLHLIGQGLKVAVLAIDPSSSVSGGSILGDKTRMQQLCSRDDVFIRPSPNAGNLGGVASMTRETILLCEAAGYDVIIVETVGVGQSETVVHGMTDLFVLLQLPYAGDDLQAMKKGVMELADCVLINKADIDHAAAEKAKLQIKAAMRIAGRNEYAQTVMVLSGLTGAGVADFWRCAQALEKERKDTGQWQHRRQHQALHWMNEHIDAGLKTLFINNKQVQELYEELKQNVLSEKIAASVAAQKLLQAYRS